MHSFYEVNLLNYQVHCARSFFDNVSKKICPLQMLWNVSCITFWIALLLGSPLQYVVVVCKKKYKQTKSLPLDSYKYLEYHLTVFRIPLENYKYLIYIIKRLFFLVKVFPWL